MAYSVTPLAGIDLTNISNYNDNSAGTEIPTQGPAVNASTFVATASGGTYLSPATAMASGDYGWFSKASV